MIPENGNAFAGRSSGIEKIANLLFRAITKR